MDMDICTASVYMSSLDNHYYLYAISTVSHCLLFTLHALLKLDSMFLNYRLFISEFQSLILLEDAGSLPVHSRGCGELWTLADWKACNPLDLHGHHPDTRSELEHVQETEQGTVNQSLILKITIHYLYF